MTLLSGCFLKMVGSEPENNFSDGYSYIKDNKSGATVYFLDVGQADCTFIKTPKLTALIDAGNVLDGKNIVKFLQSLGIQKIDYLINTHPHEDHLGGMSAVIENFNIGKIYMPKISRADMPTTGVYNELLNTIEQKNCDVYTAKSGVTAFESDNTSIKILSPYGTNYGNLNNYSAVTKFTYYNTGILIMGDAERVIEKELIEKSADIKADIVRVGHHGSSNSNSRGFLKETCCKDAVISCGINNNYHHPSKSTLKTLDHLNLRIYRTDTSGTVIASVSKDGYAIETDSDICLDGGARYE